MATQTDIPSIDSLPDPDEHPGRIVLIFDGHCKFCRKQVLRLYRLDWTRRMAFISLHDGRVGRWAGERTHDQLMEEMVAVTPDGRQYGAAAAVRYLSRHMPALWPIAPLMHIPGSLAIWNWGYRTIARQRYRWGRIKDECDEGSCHIHFR